MMSDEYVRVLLAEDHPAMRAGIRAILENAPGIEVVAEAEDGMEAKRLVSEHRPDVLMLDLRMPGPRPAEVISWVRQECPETAVLVLTAHNVDAYLAIMLEEGAAGFLLKEQTPEEIVEAVRRAAQGEVFFDQFQQSRAYRWRAEVGHRWRSLTAREQEVLALVAQGKTDQEIAAVLQIEKKTVANHVSRTLNKLAVSSRTEAALWYEREIARSGFLSGRSSGDQ
jgi:DNA-binding NarL/FixJ family response regulator